MLIIGSTPKSDRIEPTPEQPQPKQPTVGAAISRAVREVLTLKKGSKRGDHKKK